MRLLTSQASHLRSFTLNPRSKVPFTRQIHTSLQTQGLLAGRNALITGASRGIGAAIASRFANEGATCILVGRNLERLQLVQGALHKNKNGHRILTGDVGNAEFWKEVQKEKYVDILVNAAGITHYSPLFTTSLSLVDEVLQTNLVGTIMGCRTVGKNMIKTGGSIINVASLLGSKGGTGSAAYVASKAGVIGLTRALAAELGERNIRVNVIVPGYIETEMIEGIAMTPKARQEALNSIPMKRFGQSSEIADAAVFLATNKYANNCVLNLDGGLSAI